MGTKQASDTKQEGSRPAGHLFFDLLYYCAAFFIPAAGMLVILYSRHFYPFGENTLFTGDMRTQYAEFFASLRYIFSGDNSIFCSWSRSWGGNYIGLFAYYLASPLSWLVNLFPLEKLYVGILLLTICKLGLCGLTFAIFARSMYIGRMASSTRLIHPATAVCSAVSVRPDASGIPMTPVRPAAPVMPDGRAARDDVSLRQFLLLPLAVSYALMSYNIVYSQALMWLDGVIWLPLVIMGVEKLLEGRRGLMLTLSLAAAFWSNYYTGYMIALFTVLYVFFRLTASFRAHPGRAQDSPAGLLILLRFACCSLLSAGLSAPLLLPVFLDLFTGKLTGVTVSATGTISFPIPDFLRKFTVGAYDSLTYSNLPYVYCGYLALALALLFFTRKGIALREKIGAFCVLLLLFLGMYVTKLNILWHGFKLPNSYPFRDSFVFSFFVLYLALRAMLELGTLELATLELATPELGTLELTTPELGVSVLSAPKLGTSELATPEVGTPYTEDTPSPASTAPDSPARRLPSRSPRHLRRLRHPRLLSCGAFLLLMLVVSIDMGLNGRALLFHVEDEYDYDTVTDYENYLVTTQPLISGIKSGDDGFYRINQLYEYSKNDALLWGYNGLSHYSSTYNQSVNDLTKTLGMSADWLWNAGYGSTPLTDSLLSVRYVLARYPLPQPYELISESGYGTASYRNPFALPLAYSAPLSELSPDFGDDVFENQNLLLNAIAGENINCFEAVAFETDNTNPNKNQDLEDSGKTGAFGWTYSLIAPSAAPLYLMMPSDEYTYTEVYVNDRFAGNYFSSETKCCLYLGTFSAGEPVTVSVRPSASLEVAHPQIYALSLNKLEASLERLRANGMYITAHKNGTLKGRITIPTEGFGTDSITASDAGSPACSIVTSIPFDRGWSVKIDGKKVPTACFADTFLVLPSQSLASLAPGEHSITISYLSPGVLPGLLLHIVSLCLLLWDIRRGRRL